VARQRLRIDLHELLEEKSTVTVTPVSPVATTSYVKSWALFFPLEAKRTPGDLPVKSTGPAQ
jgi:hypothetical protein